MATSTPADAVAELRSGGSEASAADGDPTSPVITVPEATTRVLVADDQGLFRDAVAMALAEVVGMTVAGEASDATDALYRARTLRPDVALVGARLPNGHALRTIRSMVSERACRRVVVLDSHDDPRMLLAGVEAGALGYVTKADPPPELIAALGAVAAGRASIPARLLPGLLAGLVDRRGERAAAVRRLSRLSAREREVLAHLARGSDNADIALRLVISTQTARTHVQNILEKLGVHSRLEAVAFVHANELMSELVDEPE